MSDTRWHLSIGAQVEDGGVRFRVWAPGHERVDVVVYGPDAEMLHPLAPEGDGYFAGRVEGIGEGARYRYRLDGAESYPDPASRSQPEGVHGPSAVVDPGRFRWSDEGWRGRPPEEMVIYEAHVGTATAAGTFEALIRRLDHLAKLGVTALEILPVADFPGERNWGYDGVNLFAPSRAYGGPEGLRRLVDAAHDRDIAVILDVVYNHLGPEGNYLPAVTSGHFFTDRHKTPWGDAVNYDGEESGPVRDFVIQNALHWVHEYHVDGLRLDATHAIVDDSPVHLLQELSTRLRASTARRLVLIAEDERNERRVVLPVEEGGMGLNAVWADDFHHQLRRLAAGDEEGYFASYSGTSEDLATTLRQGWFYRGQVSPHTGEARGTSTEGLPPSAFVLCIQNHDQVGNRAFGNRLSEDVEPAVYRAASALLLLAPHTPLLWMGQEWMATSPFLYFTDHPEELGRLVTEGRREEFKHFSAFADPEVRHTIPDPQARETFERSKLHWDEMEEPRHFGMLKLYTALLELRRRDPLFRGGGAFSVAPLGEGSLVLRREGTGAAGLVVVGFGDGLAVELEADAATRGVGGAWELVLSTEEERFGGSGAARLEDGVLRLAGAGAAVLRSG